MGYARQVAERARTESAESPASAANLEAAIAGDRLAYGRLVRIVNGYLIRWRAFDFDADWEDMVQEVLYSALEAHRADRIPNEAAFMAFVRRAARNKFVDRIRKAQRDGPSLELDEDRDAGSAQSGLPWPPDPGEGQEGSVLRAQIREALEALPERERDALVEVYLQGRTYAEASERLGRPLGSLKDDLKAGMRRLRRALQVKT